MKAKVSSLYLFLACFSALCASQRDTLEVVNDTHRDEGGPTRDLYLIWDGDVKDPPQYTERLTPGEMDSRDSVKVKAGHNVKNYEITVFRWKDGKKLRIGRFIHGIYNPPLLGGHTETTRIFKNYAADHVTFYREYYVNDEKCVAPIGSIPRDQW